jgi:two-component system sensor histidine kinase PilS (NtrC family)
MTVETAPPAPASRPSATPAAHLAGRTLPDQRTLLSGIFAIRGIVAIGLLVGAALAWTTEPAQSFIISVAFILAFLLTVYGYWAVWLRDLSPSPLLLYIQSVADLGLATAVVHYTGGQESVFPALYVLLIAGYALLLPFRSGVVVPLVAAALYALDLFLLQPSPPGLGFWGQLAIFSAAYALVGSLAARLREAGRERDTLQTELRRVRLEADDILRHIRSGVLTVDGLGRLAFLNPMGERLLHLSADNLTGQPILDRLKLRSPELWAAVVAAIRHGRKVSRGEGMVSHEDGRMFPIGLSTTTFERDSDDLPSVTAIFTDISDLKRLQELHLRAERLEAVAALSASLAHEIRNPLASIRSSVEQLARTTRVDDDDRVLAQLIVRESDRLSRLLSEFLDFARVRASQFVPVDLHAVTSAAAQLVREHPDCTPGSQIKVHGARTVLDGDEDLLHRVVVNLLLNAVQASRGPAEITVTTGIAKVGDLPHGSGIDNPVRLEIRDKGPGIPDEVRRRLFEPFVTGRAGGTGLGLAIVQRAVEAHRGIVLVDSQAGGGTTFTIYFPARWTAEDAA